MPDRAHELAESFINGNLSHVAAELVNSKDLDLFQQVWSILMSNDPTGNDCRVLTRRVLMQSETMT